MDLICATCSQPNPAGAKLCSRCSSIFPPTTADALSSAQDSAPPATAVAAETLVDVARRPEAVASETLVAPSGPAIAAETLVAAASAGSETLVAPSAAEETIVAPSEPPPPAPPRRTPAPRAPSRGGTPPPGARFDAAAVAAGSLQAGDHLGTRYEIVKLLGKGGMGAVYLARDLDLGRDVAMKLIAPHLANDTGVLERFKREIQLSSIVTHPNVLRVYDLGESDGIKFLTMQFIEGETLADLIARERPLPLEKTLTLFKQICEALAAAHDKGVLHRDLKPQNVMLDAEHHVYLMDFGLATSRAVTAMTQVGAIMGTPQYMSPEQVKGTQTDARSDIFSLGVMLYEMLSGELPFNGESLFEIMIKRTQGPPRPVGELNADVPVYLRQLVDRCLAVDPMLRYHDLQELLFDLQAGSVAAPIKKRRGPSRKALLAGAALLAAVVAGGVVTTVARRAATQENVAAKPVTVLVADFDNRTGESVFNGTLEPALATALEGASFITTYNRGAAQRVADQLKIEGTGLTEKRARLVAQREGVAVVTVGYVEQDGKGYRVGVRAVDAFTGQRILEQSESVGAKGDVLQAIPKLAAAIRRKLGDATPEGVQLKEALTFGAASLEAAHEYGLATSLALEGKWDDARSHFLESLKLDPQLGRSYAGLAVLEANLGRRSQAETYFKEALARVGRMSDREKLRTLGVYYLINKDTDQAIDTYMQLVKQYPVDNVGLAMLSLAYVQKRDFAKALEFGRRASAIYPNNIMGRNNVGMITLMTGDFPKAVTEQEKVIELNPAYVNGYIGLALAQVGVGQLDAARATWDKLATLGTPIAASMSAEGLADLAVFEGRLADATKLVASAVSADTRNKEMDAAARKLAIVADAQLAVGQLRAAAVTARRMLQMSKDDHVTFVAASALATAGEAKQALSIADELDQRFGKEPRMYADIVRGLIEARRRNHPDAIARFRSAVQRLDAWTARYTLGRAFIEAGAYAPALEELERCEQRRGEAADVTLEIFPSFHLYPAVRYYLGRALEGLNSPAAAEKYQAFLALKTSDEDPMVKDARKRLAALTAAASTGAAPAAK